MNRKMFWLGYLLAIAAVVWILWRQRREDVQEAIHRIRETGYDGLRWAPQDQAREMRDKKERVEERSSGPDRAGQVAKTRGEVGADNLQEIYGIGPVFARRLREAGITRFDQLANLSPDEVRRRLDLKPWHVDVDSWIDQAKARLSGR